MYHSPHDSIEEYPIHYRYIGRSYDQTDRMVETESLTLINYRVKKGKVNKTNKEPSFFFKSLILNAIRGDLRK